MTYVRLIAKLDIKGKNLVKTINLDGLRILGDPNQFAQNYYNEGIDEIIYLDVVASLYGRNHLSAIISDATKGIFVPLTVGGGVRTVEDVKSILRAGADKVAINTYAVEKPGLISQIADEFGSQCLVSNIEARRRIGSDGWEVVTHSGREPTGIDAVEWAQICESNGAGEILLTSIDQEGTRKGYDLSLIREVCSRVNIPVISSGGMGKMNDAIYAAQIEGVTGVAMSDFLHYRRSTLKELRQFAHTYGVKVRSINEE
jgi:cyclase